MTTRPPVTFHVLDTGSGVPASNMLVEISHNTSKGDTEPFQWIKFGECWTNSDGRGTGLLPDSMREIPVGIYKMKFHTKEYYLQSNTTTFYPFVSNIYYCLFGTCMVHVWYMYGTCMVHVWYMYGTCMVHVLWYVYGTCMVHVWYMYGTCMVLYGTCMVLYGTCMVLYGTCMVHVWYMYGTCMVHVWYMYGVILCCSSSNSSYDVM
jgi:5-hydroxyisourate hydrolase